MIIFVNKSSFAVKCLIIHIIFLLLFCNRFIYSQFNLVNNFSLEDTIKCPDGQAQLQYAKGWIHATEPPGQPMADYYNACSSIANVPHAAGCGFQYARTGVAYAGIWAYHIQVTDVREYIETFLTDTLKTMHCYYIAFYVSMADKIFYAVNRMGAHISDTLIHKTTDYFYLKLTPQIENPTNRFLTDTANWTKISGIYKAHGREKYITIGNFYPDSLTDTLKTISSIAFPMSYYFIDDVLVIDVSANAGRDTTICKNDSAQLGSYSVLGCKYEWSPTTGLSNPNIANPKAKPKDTTIYVLTVTFKDTVFNGANIDTIYTCITTDTVTVNVCDAINEIEGKGKIKVYPNPVKDQLTINNYQSSIKKIIIKDLQGRTVSSYDLQQNMSYSYTIDVSNLSNGVYILNLQNDKENLVSRIIIQR
jgi:hypothetical protein